MAKTALLKCMVDLMLKAFFPERGDMRWAEQA